MGSRPESDLVLGFDREARENAKRDRRLNRSAIPAYETTAEMRPNAPMPS
jgi:hypothetical protein